VVGPHALGPSRGAVTSSAGGSATRAVTTERCRPFCVGPSMRWASYDPVVVSRLMRGPEQSPRAFHLLP